MVLFLKLVGGSPTARKIAIGVGIYAVLLFSGQFTQFPPLDPDFKFIFTLRAWTLMVWSLVTFWIYKNAL